MDDTNRESPKDGDAPDSWIVPLVQSWFPDWEIQFLEEAPKQIRCIEHSHTLGVWYVLTLPFPRSARTLGMLISWHTDDHFEINAAVLLEELLSRDCADTAFQQVVADLYNRSGTAISLSEVRELSTRIPLIGRDNELSTVHDLLDFIQAAKECGKRSLPSPLVFPTQLSPQLILLMGERGIGKTRLVEEVSRLVRKRGCQVIFHEIKSTERQNPSTLWREVMEHLFLFLPSPSAEYQSRFSLWTQTVPMDPAGMEFVLHETLIVIAKTVPILLIVDNLHLADDVSSKILFSIAGRVSDLPVSIAATCCKKSSLPATHPISEYLPHLERARLVKRVHLRPLSDEHIGNLITAIFDLPESMIGIIQRQSAGNPHLALEVAAALARDDFHECVQIPGQIQEIIARWFMDLSEDCRQVLRFAAFLGESFSLPQLCEQMRQCLVSPLEEDTVLTLLEEGCHARIVIEVPDPPSFRFTTPLLPAYLKQHPSKIEWVR